jgi:hypothetical protein
MVIYSQKHSIGSVQECGCGCFLKCFLFGDVLK